MRFTVSTGNSMVSSAIWQNMTNACFSKLHQKSCCYQLIICMKKVEQYQKKKDNLEQITVLPFYGSVLPWSCVAHRQSESRNFFMYIIKSETRHTAAVTKAFRCVAVKVGHCVNCRKEYLPLHSITGVCQWPCIWWRNTAWRSDRNMAWRPGRIWKIRTFVWDDCIKNDLNSHLISKFMLMLIFIVAKKVRKLCL